MIEFEVKGIVPSKANCYRKGRYSFYKDDKVKYYETDFRYQTQKVPKNTFCSDTALFIKYEFHIKNMRQDCDNIEKTVNDCLEKCEIIPNDKNILYHFTMKIQDRENPRVRISISELANG